MSGERTIITANHGKRAICVDAKTDALHPEVATTIAQIACDGTALPQGSPCSPVISELIAQILDMRLVRLAKKYGVTYTRYADDITFSTSQKDFPAGLATVDPSDPAIWHLSEELVGKIVTSGFTINAAKTRMHFRGSRQMVTGLVVNEKVNIRSDYYRRARAMCDMLFRTGQYYMLPQGQLDESVEKHVKIMDEVGTDLAIVSPRPFTLMHSHDRFDDISIWVRLQNDIIHQNVVKHPTRFRGMAALPQMNGAPIETVFEELDRCVSELGFVGVLLNPDPAEGKGDGPHLGETYWYSLWEKLEELDVPALIHSAGCCGRETYDEHFATEESMAITKLAHTDVFERFPNLKIIVSHGGGAIPYQIGRWRSHWLMSQGANKAHIAKYFKEVEEAAKAGQAFPERPEDLVTFDDMLRKFYFDTDVHDPTSMQLLFEKVGTDRCLFGTERPGSGGGLNLETGRPLDDLKYTIDNIPSLTPADRRALYQDNALKLFSRIPSEILEGRVDNG